MRRKIIRRVHLPISFCFVTAGFILIMGENFYKVLFKLTTTAVESIIFQNSFRLFAVILFLTGGKFVEKKVQYYVIAGDILDFMHVVQFFIVTTRRRYVFGNFVIC